MRYSATALLGLALTLTACAGSGKPTPRLPVRPPASSLPNCSLPPLPEKVMDQAEAEIAIIEHRAEIRRCEAKRAALVKGWPK